MERREERALDGSRFGSIGGEGGGGKGGMRGVVVGFVGGMIDVRGVSPFGFRQVIDLINS